MRRVWYEEGRGGGEEKGRKEEEERKRGGRRRRRGKGEEGGRVEHDGEKIKEVKSQSKNKDTSPYITG